MKITKCGNKRYPDRHQLIGTDTRWKEAEDHFPTEAQRCSPNHYGLATIDMPKKKRSPTLDQEAIDQLVVSQANDDSAWEAPVQVSRSKPAALSLPGELAARAAFLAKLHREPGIDKWVERVVRERVELEEFAYAEAKKKLAS